MLSPSVGLAMSQSRDASKYMSTGGSSIPPTPAFVYSSATPQASPTGYVASSMATAVSSTAFSATSYSMPVAAPQPQMVTYEAPAAPKRETLSLTSMIQSPTVASKNIML